jgi:phytanoyl-CoA hydroxylase
MKEYFEKGYFLFKKNLDIKIINDIVDDIKNIYRRQFNYLKLQEESIGFDNCLINMFNMDLKRYIHCNRTACMLPSVYKLAYNDSIINCLKDIGIKTPILCQKPTLRMDCEKLAIAKEYYQLPVHQDYKSMQGSLNSVVVSIPLVDVNEDLGALKVIPSSHKIGFLKGNESMENKSKLEALKAVEIRHNYKESEFVSISQDVGDMLVISSFILHKSGTNILNTPRYTLLIRFNDLEDEHFLEQGFISPFKTTHEDALDDSLDYKTLLQNYFK